jgi:hypothetical protein
LSFLLWLLEVSCQAAAFLAGIPSGFLFFNFELRNKLLIIAVRLTSLLNHPHQLSQLVRFPSGHSFLVKSATVHDFNHECAISLSSMSPRPGYWNPAGWKFHHASPQTARVSQSPNLRDMWNKVTPIHFPWSFRRFYIITEHRSLSATCNKPGFCLWISGLGMCVRRLDGSSVPALYFVFCVLCLLKENQRKGKLAGYCIRGVGAWKVALCISMVE